MKLKLYSILLVFVFISGSVLSTPLSGVYTIGGTSPDYATFSAALSALSASGISGPATFNARPGTYNETVTFSAVTGASATNRITFQSEDGVAADVTIRASSNGGGYYNPIFVLSAAQYYTFNNLTITYGSVSSGYVYIFLMQFVYGSLNDSINHCILNGINYGNGVADNWIIWDQNAGSGVGTNSNVVFNGCQFNGGAYAYADAYSTTPGGPSFINNTFTGQALGALVFTSCNNVYIQGNTFNASTNTSYVGIEMDQCTNASIVGNKLLNGDGIGIWFDCASCSGYGSTGAVSSNFYMANNYIESQYGIRGAGVDSFSIYNNTLRTTMQGITLTSGSGNILLDNVFDNTGTGTSEVFNLNSASDFKECDYNDFYSAGLLARITGTYSNLAAWQTGTGFDVHSRSVLPPFVSSTDYHLTDCDSLKFGLALGITYDIDSDLRNAVSPVVGAYECPSFSLIAKFGASDTAICMGSTVTFTDESAGSPTSWRWTFAGATPNTSSLQGTNITYDTAGSFAVKLVVSNHTGADSIIKTGYINVYAVPKTGTISPNPDSICSGTFVRLSDTGSTGNGLQWQSSINGSNYSNINGANSSTYNTSVLTQSASYRLIVSNGVCADTSSPVVVTVNPTPIPPVLSVNDSIICSNDSSLILTSGSYASYLWNDGDTTSHTWANAAGAYWVTVTDANGCTVVSGQQNIYVYPVPGDFIIEQGDTLSSYGGVSYQWYFNDAIIPGAAGAVYVARETGKYAVQVTDTNGCTYRTSNVYITVTGIGGLDIGNSINIYPAPATNTIFIAWNDATINIGDVEIYNILGERVLNGEATSFYTSPLAVDISTLQGGVYIIAAKIGNNTEFVKRMIKE